MQVEGHPIRHPGPGLHRSAIAVLREKLAVWAADVNLNHLSIRRIPVQRSRTEEGAAGDRYGIGIRRQRGPHGGAGRVDGTQTDIALERISAGVRQVLNIQPTYRRIIERNLDRRVPGDEVSAHDVSLNAGGQKDPVRIPNNDILLNHIAGIGCGDEADAEVVPLSNVAVSAQPVRTEPVVAGATRQSYTAAGTAAVSVAHGDVVLEQMTGSADNDHAGQAISGHGHAGQRDPRAVIHHNPLIPKTLHYS